MCEGDEEDGGGETEKINLEHHRGKVRNKGAEFISGPLWGEQTGQLGCGKERRSTLRRHACLYILRGHQHEPKSCGYEVKSCVYRETDKICRVLSTVTTSITRTVFSPSGKAGNI